jgi:hypothetical protein
LLLLFLNLNVGSPLSFSFSPHKRQKRAIKIIREKAQEEPHNKESKH